MVQMMIDDEDVDICVDEERLERMHNAVKKKNKPVVLVCACVIREDDASLSRKKMR